MPVITTTITPFTHTPSRQNPSTFSDDMDIRLSEENSRITQMNNLGDEMNDVADLVNTIEANLDLVANDLTNIDTVATNIENVNTISTNIAKVSNLDTNMTKIANLDTNMAKIANVDNNMAKVSSLDTNMTAIITVNTNIADVAAVADNEANINIVATNIGSITSKIGTTDIHNATPKTTPVDADELALLDSADSFSLKKLTFANLKATLKSYFDTIYDLATVWVANDSRVKTALNASGDAPIYACRAWVNFNGTGTVAIRASGNVSSITDLGTGQYTVNFITDMPDANYCVQMTAGNNDNTATPSICTTQELTVSSVRVYIENDDGTKADRITNCVAIIR